jgi:cell wall-associated NlpC family hydrolase
MKKILYFLLFLVFCIGFNYTEDERVHAFYSRVVIIARESVGLKIVPPVNGRRFTCDCIGFVDYVFYRAGFDLKKAYGKGHGGVDTLYDGLEEFGFVYKDRIASPGDLIFFDNTYDVKGRRRWDNPLSHIGIIVGNGKYNTMEFIHFANNGVEEGAINLFYPNTHAVRQHDGELYTINSYLRRDRGEGYIKRDYVASYFYRAFARVKLKAVN